MKHRVNPQLGFVLAVGLAESVAISPKIEQNGQPVQKFRKDLIGVGQWTHPDTGDEINVTTADLDRWVETFAAMKQNGVKVYVPSGHTSDSDANRGWVTEMYRDGDTLIGILEIVGEDAIKEAARNEVSIRVMTFKDGKGNEYKNAIEHVALTPVPVISGQGGMVAIAASRGGTIHVPAFRLAQNGAVNMESLKKIAEAMGIEVPDDATEESLTAAILAKHASMTEAGKAKAEAATTATAALSAARAELAKAKGEAPIRHDATTIELARDNRGMKIEALSRGGQITPAVAKALRETWTPDSDDAMSLSLHQNSLFKATLAALELNDPKVLGEQTRRQTLELDRATPGGDGYQFDAKASEERAKRAYGIKTA